MLIAKKLLRLGSSTNKTWIQEAIFSLSKGKIQNLTNKYLLKSPLFIRLNNLLEEINRSQNFKPWTSTFPQSQDARVFQRWIFKSRLRMESQQWQINYNFRIKGASKSKNSKVLLSQMSMRHLLQTKALLMSQAITQPT